MRGVLIGLALVAASAGSAQAATIGTEHVQHHLRVDGTSDLRGKVHARSGLDVTDGLSTDTLSARGPVTVGGTLTVSGAATVGSLNAGSGAVTTTGAVQGGTLTLASDATVGGSLTVAGRGSVTGLTVGGDGITSSGSFSGTSATLSGSLVAGSGTITHLTVPSGGTVDFNNVAIRNLNLAGAALSSLQISNAATGGLGGTQLLTLSQDGQTAGLSVGSDGLLTVSGFGLSAASATITNNLTVGGSLSARAISSNNTLTLTAPTVATTGDLQLGASGSNRGHLLGNPDTRGQCQLSASPGGVNTCGVTFGRVYAAPPVVVVTPVGSNPGVVESYSVQPTSSGFTISFIVTAPATVTFDYIVEQ